jgi:hypothetical protein
MRRPIALALLVASAARAAAAAIPQTQTVIRRDAPAARPSPGADAPAGPRPVPVCGTVTTSEPIGSVEPWMLVGGTPRALNDEPARGFRLVINPGPGLAAVPAAVAAFERAADQWRRVLRDPITVTVDADFEASEDDRWLGRTGPRVVTDGYDRMRMVLIRDAGPRDAIVSALPTPDGLRFQAPMSVHST